MREQMAQRQEEKSPRELDILSNLKKISKKLKKGVDKEEIKVV